MVVADCVLFCTCCNCLLLPASIRCCQRLAANTLSPDCLLSRAMLWHAVLCHIHCINTHRLTLVSVRVPPSCCSTPGLPLHLTPAHPHAHAQHSAATRGRAEPQQLVDVAAAAAAGVAAVGVCAAYARRRRFNHNDKHTVAAAGLTFSIHTRCTATRWQLGLPQQTTAEGVAMTWPPQAIAATSCCRLYSY